MNGFFYLILAGVLFSITLCIVYFIRGHIENDETKIYSSLIVTNLINLILELACTYIGYKIELNSLLAHIVTKLYMSSTLVFTFFITIYMFILCYVISNKKNKVLYLKIKDIARHVFFISLTLIFILPIETGAGYAVGASTNFLFFMFLLVSCVCAVTLAKNYKYIDKKKAIPLVLFILFLSVTAIIQKRYPEATLTTFFDFLVVFIMYHTIENPDLKIIDDLKIAKDAVEKANRAKSDFLSSMSQEIKTPLNAITVLSEDILTFKNEVPKQVKEESEKIIVESKKLIEIVDNILDINKIESNKIDVEEIPYVITSEVDDLVEINKTKIGKKPIELKIHFEEDIPYELIGDKIHIKKIINNLLSNAIKYTDEGIVSLNIKCINNNENCNLIISVEDTGRGIKQEDINRLFDNKSDDEKNTTIGDTGLGLSITKKLVEMLGGTIKVNSTYGKGSIFVVNISQKISKMSKTNITTKIESSETKIDYQEKKILVVDDNLSNIKEASRALSDLNVKIDNAMSGKEAIEKVNSNKYDLILLDIMMPEMDGIDTLKQLKEIENFNVPAIALTADDIPGSKEKYMSMGFDDYIAKPFTKNQIKEKLDKILK